MENGTSVYHLTSLNLRSHRYTRASAHARTHARTHNTHTHWRTHSDTHTHLSSTPALHRKCRYCTPHNCTNTRTRISLTVHSDSQQLLQQMIFGVWKRRLSGREKASLPTLASFLMSTWFHITNVSWQAHCWLFPMCVCVCPTDSKIKIKSSVFYSICILNVYVSYCMLFYWSLLCSRKANFDVIHRQ